MHSRAQQSAPCGELVDGSWTGAGPMRVRAAALPVPAHPLAHRQDRIAAAMPTWVGCRASRVWVLTITIAVLSLTDLCITLTYLQSIGMSEGNPIARLIMSYNSPAILIAWKLATITLTSLAFILGRKRRVAELGCWLCVGVLGWLTHRWIDYSHEVAKVTPVIHVLVAGECSNWVKMGDQNTN